MPELPDITVYVESLERRIVRQRLERVRLLSPFVLRSVEPPLTAVAGRRVAGVRRLGKRIVLALEEELFLVLHLMIAGRLRWLRRGDKPPARIVLALFDFPDGTLAFTEAGTKKRASLHVVRGESALAAFDTGGVEVVRRRPARVPLAAAAGEPYAQARAHRPAPVQRHRQCLCGRNPASRPGSRRSR